MFRQWQAQRFGADITGNDDSLSYQRRKECKIVSIQPNILKIPAIILSSNRLQSAPTGRCLTAFLVVLLGLSSAHGQIPSQNEGTNPTAPTSPATSQAADAAATAPAPNKESAPTGGGAPVDSNTYKIGPTDVLSVSVWNEASFSGQFTVHQDGKFTMPLVGELEAGGKTPIEVQDIVAKALTKVLKKPLVTVTVQAVGSKRYYLDGQVPHPGEFQLVTPTTVFEAISRAGGIGEFANSKKIYVLRGGQRIFFNYKQVLKGKNMAQDIPLKPGDHVVVP